MRVMRPLRASRARSLGLLNPLIAGAAMALSMHRIKMMVISRPCGVGQRSRLAAAATWARAGSATWRVTLGGRGGQVAGEEHRRGRQAVVLAVLAYRLEEAPGRGDGVLLRAAADGLGDNPRQVAFEQGTIAAAEGVDLRGGLGQ